ncbi:aminotransferase class I/II-fold pyridoxal phosphate-dependent enzyme [Streptomyces sp. 8K308]|uniref:aminotransferase class I/II-fold pyridoxal phosphate-dependent enzyme n=1 Tax=Streptomyces sp. 8K308 TaxID=2530388 RepID=UPI0014046127|nr:aminotransferase class I/II-fold pyridoxal phosphate-dependent enzyme [Streptomyces sp. 8K308]
MSDIENIQQFAHRPKRINDAVDAFSSYSRDLNFPLQRVVDLDAKVINLASYDYLGLHGNPGIAEAVREAVGRLGTGSGGSSRAIGHHAVHQTLSERLASAVGHEHVTLFSSGYAANVGILSQLMRPGDVVFLDRLAHASAIDGAKLSGARVATFPHNDPVALDRRLTRLTCDGERLVYVEGFYSMDGDRAPLAEIAAVCQKHGALLLVDEAHSEFLVGPRHRGSCDDAGIVPDIYMGTLSKTLNAQGGFIAAGRELGEWIETTTRARIFSGNLSPLMASAALAALDVVAAEPSRRDRLWANTRAFRDALAERGVPAYGDTQIVAIPVPDEHCYDISAQLLRDDIWVGPAVYPVVPVGKARLRLSITAALDPGQLLQAADRIAHAMESRR